MPPKATARWLAAHRTTRHRGRQDLLRVQRRLLAAQPGCGLDREPRADEREDPERHREVRVGEAGAAPRGDDVGERLVVLDEVVDAVGDRAVGDAGEQHRDAPADEAASLQSHREADGAPEARRRVRAARARCDQPAADVPPSGERDGDDDERTRRDHEHEERPPHFVRERSCLLRPADRREPRDRAVADVADRAQHERRAKHRTRDPVDHPRVLAHLRGDQRDRRRTRARQV